MLRSPSTPRSGDRHAAASVRVATFPVRQARTAAVAALLLALNAAPALAQFGGLGRRIKERVEKVADDHAGPAADSAVRTKRLDAPRFDNNVLELTPDVLDRVLKADDAERAHAERRRAVLARIDAVTHPAARPAASAPRAQDPGEKFGECVQKYLGTDAETVRRHCGDARDVIAREQALDKARRDAERARADSLHRDSTIDIPADSVRAMAGGFTRRQYGIVKERISAYLAGAARADAAAQNPCLDNTPSDYTFTDEERAALASRREQLATRFTLPRHMRTGRKSAGCPKP